MHDFLEGVVPFTIKIFLYVLAFRYQELGIDATLLNDRIDLFCYSYNDLSNKPSAKFTDEGIRKKVNYSTKQRASQNWCLIRMLPFLIGDLIPVGHEAYGLIITLRWILDIVFAPVIALEHTVELEILNILYFEKFRSFFPGVQAINKVHHMLHFPHCIRENGLQSGIRVCDIKPFTIQLRD